MVFGQLVDKPDQMKAERENGGGEDVLWSTVDINQACGKAENMKVISKERSTQSSDEPETVGAAGGGKQMSGAGKKVSKVSSLSEDSGVASGSPLPASSTDVALSPINPIANSYNSKTKNAALVNEDISACGISQRMKGNSGDRSTQSNAETQETEQTKETAVQQSEVFFGPTKRKWKDKEGSEILLSTSGERDDPEKVPKMLTRSWAKEASNKSNSQTVYIRIPFSVMSGNESPSSTDTVVQNKSPTYKLIDGVPNLTEIRKRKSYALLYDNRTKNAAWVYEILNSETLKQEVERQNVFSVDQSIHPFYQASTDLYQHPYVRGHLVAAANHRWCQKALEDTFLMSNISPQHTKLNNGSWKSLEQEYHRKAKDKQNDICNVHVYTGPLYLPRDKKYKEIRGQAVPTHFFKVIIVEHCDGTVELKCYQMSNDESEYSTVTIEEIERASGLIFRENSCSKGETDSDREITWTGENEYGETCTVKTQVKISTPCS
uniref:Uncharacterized protein n=1 Tax=Cyprinus carpio TaxID=7962 RepID=A0A8C1P6W8_CYPCA